MNSKKKFWSDRSSSRVCFDLYSWLCKDKEVKNFQFEKQRFIWVQRLRTMLNGDSAGRDGSQQGQQRQFILEQFLEALKKSIELTLPYIKKRGYVVVFIKDLQPHKKDVNLLHADVVNKLNEIKNLYYKGMKIWSDESTKLYPYGYPFCFVANQIHQYILVFRKEK